MKHLILSLLCLICLSLSSQNPVINGIEYQLDNTTKTASVLSCQIPGIRNWEMDSMSINKVVIPGVIKVGKVSYRVTTISKQAFAQSPGLVSVKLPSSLKTICDYAFTGCSNLNRIIIPASVTELGEGCFSACDNLISVTLPATLKTIPVRAFAYCQSLQEITLPIGLTVIGEAAFLSCGRLNSIKYPLKLQTIGASAFAESGLRYTKLPSTVTTIGNKAFSNCQQLDSIMLPSSLTNLGDSVFHECANLQKVNIQKCLSYGSLDNGSIFYQRKAGDYCTILFFNMFAEECVVPDSFNIAAGVFRDHVVLKRVKLHRRVKSIGDFAFAGCASLSEITIPSKIEYIGDGAFMGCNSLKGFNVFQNKSYFTSENGRMLFRKKSSGVVMISYLDTLQTVFIPSFVTELGYGLFFCHSEIESIFMPYSLNKVAPLTFYHCTKLRSISLPSGITVIPDQLFDGCESLDQIVLPENVTKIGNKVFCNCRLLSLLVLPETLKEAGFSLFTGRVSDHLKIVSLASLPAQLRGNSFRGVANIELHVPKGSAERYRKSVSWSSFHNIIEDL